MTRFARAKGSKSSNEKKPEEATSWSEMKNALLSKPSKAPEQIVQVEKKKTAPDTQNHTEWASLGEDNSSSLLPQPSKKKNKVSQAASSIVDVNNKKLKKVMKLNPRSDNLNNKTKVSDANNKTNKKVKKKKENKSESLKEDSEMLNVEQKLNKKGKKRKLSNLNVENVDKQTKKKKKVDKLETDTSNLNSCEGKKLGKPKSKFNENKQKLKKIKTSKREDTENSFVNKGKKPQNTFKHNVNKQFDRKPNPKFKDREYYNRNMKYGNKTFNQDNSVVEELIVNGEKILIVKFQGFNVTKDDAERLRKLRNEMIKEGIPKNKMEAAIKLERRRAEKALSRLKKAVCFHCRGFGHLLSNCPVLVDNPNTSTGICYKCGSTEHSALECKVVKGTNFQFAECFICKEQGHIARQCPDNPRGLYPQGGACRECGDVTHLRKDCPQVLSKKPEETITVGLRNDRNLECLDEEITVKEKQVQKKPVKKKSIKF